MFFDVLETYAMATDDERKDKGRRRGRVVDAEKDGRTKTGRVKKNDRKPKNDKPKEDK